MALPIICALRGTVEELVLRAADASSGVEVVRRCGDLTEVLGAAQAQVGGIALLDAGQLRVDRTVIAEIVAAGLGVVVVDGDARLQEATRQFPTVVHLRGPQDQASADHLIEASRVLADAATTGSQLPPFVDGDDVRPAAVLDGTVVAVWGPTGAPGRTTLAVNLAAESARSGMATLLVDADTYGGSVAQVLGLLDESAGLVAAARMAARGELTPETLGRVCPAVMPQLRVLTGIARADRWHELPGAALDEVWHRVRGFAAVTVIDCGFGIESDEVLSFDTRAPQRNAATLSALAAADHLVVVGGGDPIGLHRLVRAMEAVAEVEHPVRRTVVVNRVRSSVAGPRPAEAVAAALARYAGITDVVVLPDDPAAADAAVMQGRALVEVAPASGLRAGIARMLPGVLSGATAAVAAH